MTLILAVFSYLRQRPKPRTPVTSPARIPPARWRRSRQLPLVASSGSSSTFTATGRFPSNWSNGQRPWASRALSLPWICPTQAKDAMMSAMVSAFLPTWNWRTWKGPLRFVEWACPFVCWDDMYHIRQKPPGNCCFGHLLDPGRIFSPSGSAVPWLGFLPVWVLASKSPSSFLKDNVPHPRCYYSPLQTHVFWSW